jgi:hypothetical protein
LRVQWSRADEHGWDPKGRRSHRSALQLMRRVTSPPGKVLRPDRVSMCRSRWPRLLACRSNRCRSLGGPLIGRAKVPRF